MQHQIPDRTCNCKTKPRMILDKNNNILGWWCPSCKRVYHLRWGDDASTHRELEVEAFTPSRSV